jgi:hypothetical protein
MVVVEEVRCGEEAVEGPCCCSEELRIISTRGVMVKGSMVMRYLHFEAERARLDARTDEPVLVPEFQFARPMQRCSPPSL